MSEWDRSDGNSYYRITSVFIVWIYAYLTTSDGNSYYPIIVASQ